MPRPPSKRSSSGSGGGRRGRFGGKPSPRTPASRRPGRPRQPGGTSRAQAPAGTRTATRGLPRGIAEEVRVTARRGQADRALRALEEAVDLLERGREAAAERAALEAKALAPRSGSVREVLGIALYRQERFREALRELQAFRRMTGRLDQNHLIADCHRALGSPAKAIAAARESLRAPISDEARVESAIVGAAALSDLGRIGEALTFLRSFPTRDRLSRNFELRLWYVTGDILERAGRTRESAAEFRRIVRHDPGAFDAAERLARVERLA
jgi:tetratricopeptide (TPR) repeat protein